MYVDGRCSTLVFAALDTPNRLRTWFVFCGSDNPSKGKKDIAEQADPEAKKADEADNGDMV